MKCCVISILLCLFSSSAISSESSRIVSPSLEYMAGQMIMTGFQGLRPEEDAVRRIADQLQRGIIGGVILYAFNVESPAQLRRLNAFLAAQQKLPLIAVDQEGGLVQRLIPAKGFGHTPSAALMAVQSLIHNYVAYSIMTKAVRNAGFNMNFAPVVDLAVDPDSPAIARLGRSYGADPAQVIDHARVCVLAHRRHGVVSALKHFPGHGSARGDTHDGFVDTSDTWLEDELIPYRRLISEGMADMVMTAHIFNKHLDTALPATLSHKVIQKLLREELGYEGVVITDDLQMGAISRHYSLKDTVLHAVQAGNDILLFSGFFEADAAMGERIHRILMEHIRQGRISRERIEASFIRIQRLKLRLYLARLRPYPSWLARP